MGRDALTSFVEPQAVQRILHDLQCSWGIAGGWAIDLFLDRITRKHEDIEIAILREDQLLLQQYFSSLDWSMQYVNTGRLLPWPAGESLALPVHEIWCQSSDGPLGRIEVLLNEREGNEFVFRRDSRIRTSLGRAFLRSIAEFQY